MDKSRKISLLFKDANWLTLALTHKSWVNEHPDQRSSNERLEFLGDAVLEFIVSKELFKLLPDKEEGYLTALRANLVNTVNLAHVAGKMDIGKLLYLSKGEEDGGGRSNTSLLANTVEALIGAIFMDSGITKAEEFIQKYLLVDLDKKIKEPLKDAKSRLQEYVQAKGFQAPKYKVEKEIGPDHDKIFYISVLVDGKRWGKGEGKNKAEAAQAAAENAIDNNIKD
ncbi:ribonuclease III [Candidatus Woesebacteria bacterium]|nr:MAG: ribonuclease III [Candidatus Woesebacteria bacterium]